MYTIKQSRRIRGNAGDPLPRVFRAFDEKDIVFRRGQQTLIAAGSGTGKSALTLTCALKWAEQDSPGLYLSPDSDAFTQVSRAFSSISGLSMEEGKRYARGQSVNEEAERKVEGLPIRFNYLASPSIPDLERIVDAFEELYGEYPHWITLDNITNFRTGIQDNDSDPFSGLEGFLDYLNTLARDTQAAVIGLHHVNGPYADGTKVIPMSGVKGQIHRVPAMVLTLFRPTPQTIGVSAVKNRGSRDDATGERYAELTFDGDRMSITDPDPVQTPGLIGPPGVPSGEVDPFERRILEEEMMG